MMSGQATRKPGGPPATWTAILAVVGTGCELGSAIDEPRDTLLVVIDTLRRDSLITFEPQSPLDERSDALARDSIVFADLRSGTSWMRTAVVSLHSHGARALPRQMRSPNIV
jgi:hypothetical protein